MKRMLERSIDVSADVRAAWAHLLEPVRWPSWATHIRRVDVTPPGPVRLGSRGIVRLKNGTKATQVVTALVEQSHWRWDGKFLWFTLTYDHCFEPLPSGGCPVLHRVRQQPRPLPPEAREGAQRGRPARPLSSVRNRSEINSHSSSVWMVGGAERAGWLVVDGPRACCSTARDREARARTGRRRNVTTRGTVAHAVQRERHRSGRHGTGRLDHRRSQTRDTPPCRLHRNPTSGCVAVMRTAVPATVRRSARTQRCDAFAGELVERASTCGHREQELFGRTRNNGPGSS